MYELSEDKLPKKKVTVIYSFSKQGKHFMKFITASRSGPKVSRTKSFTLCIDIARLLVDTP
jgi:hypothetical protein